MNYKKITENLLKDLNQRQKEVLERRFGFCSGEKETLQEIGNDFGITRERVRQIERDAFSKLKESPFLQKACSFFSNHLKEAGGAKREDVLIADLCSSKSDENYVLFLLALSSIHRINEDNDFHVCWVESLDLKISIKDQVDIILKELKKEKKPLKKDYVFKLASTPLFASALEITKHVEKGPLGEFGLAKWPEIKPRGVKDSAFLVLKKEQKPLHFRTIASLSNTLEGQTKKVLPQTVHNELIRDVRFVLVGRGIYALKEWGYENGTVKDIIIKVLKNKAPLAKDEILEEVQKQRLVKQNTVFLNLSNKDEFIKNEEGKYEIRTA